MLKRQVCRLKQLLDDQWFCCRFGFVIVLMIFIILIGYVHNLSLKAELKEHQIHKLNTYEDGGE